jgi:hypothetical protein
MYNSELVANMRSNCEHTNSAKNLALYKQMLSEDPDARESARKALICNNMQLVTLVVNELLTGRPWQEYLRDDLVSEGFLALTDIVNSLGRRHKVVQHMTSYLRTAIHYTLSRFRDTSTTSLPENAEYADERTAIDTADILDAACLTNLGRTLLELRRQGYTLHEIAAKTGLSYRTAQRRLKAVYERFEQKKKNIQKGT